MLSNKKTEPGNDFLYSPSPGTVIGGLKYNDMTTAANTAMKQLNAMNRGIAKGTRASTLLSATLNRIKRTPIPTAGKAITNKANAEPFHTIKLS